MTTMQNTTSRGGVFHSGDLVIWRDPHRRYAIPIAAVVVREEADRVVIRARVEGIIKELRVDSEQLIER